MGKVCLEVVIISEHPRLPGEGTPGWNPELLKCHCDEGHCRLLSGCEQNIQLPRGRIPDSGARERNQPVGFPRHGGYNQHDLIIRMITTVLSDEPRNMANPSNITY
jgi:hypothetical protein